MQHISATHTACFPDGNSLADGYSQKISGMRRTLPRGAKSVRLWQIFWIAALQWLLLMPGAAQAVIPTSERQVLLNLYNSTNGANWINKTGWNGPSGTECKWNGIWCNTNESHVTAIALYFNNLVGTLPSISGLTALEAFQVDGNQLTGTVPSAPTSLFSGYSNLCGNKLVSSGNATIDASWVTATGRDWLACQSSYTPPTCTLTASPSTITPGSSATLTASCSPAATSYLWVGGNCSSTSATCTVTPSATTIYTVAGVNSAGSGYVASANVNVAPAAVPASGTAIEFYKADIDHYFMTASSDEATSLDNKPSWGWARTCKTFNVWLPSSAPSNASPVCRFFGVFANGTVGSHFYTVDPGECEYVKGRLDWGWVYEGDAFYAVKPTGGACPSSTSPVYRVFNNGMGGAPNHRYMTSQTDVNTMVSQGWASEGIAMCAPTGTGSGQANCSLVAISGSCGASNGSTFTAAPTSNLCAAGTASSASGAGPWAWTCQGSNGGTNASCSANKQTTGGGGTGGASPVYGSCGASNGGTFSSVPTANLCTAGTASGVSGSGPWSWTCQGSNGGGTQSCSANKQTTGGGGTGGGGSAACDARSSISQCIDGWPGDAASCSSSFDGGTLVSSCPSGYTGSCSNPTFGGVLLQGFTYRYYPPFFDDPTTLRDFCVSYSGSWSGSGETGGGGSTSGTPISSTLISAHYEIKTEYTGQQPGSLSAFTVDRIYVTVTNHSNKNAFCTVTASWLNSEFTPVVQKFQEYDLNESQTIPLFAGQSTSPEYPVMFQANQSVVKVNSVTVSCVEA